MKKVAISKSMEEVWIWKERCYEESKGLSVADYLNEIHKQAEKTLNKTEVTPRRVKPALRMIKP